MIPAIIWDVDGTLVDSEPNHHRALVAVCKNYGVCIDDFENTDFVGRHMHEVWWNLQSRFPKSTNFEAWHQAINSEYAQGIADVAVRSHAANTIVSLWQHNIRQAAVSNSSRAIVDSNLRVVSGSEHFEFALSIEDVAHGKPSPQPYYEACTRLGLTPAQVLIVEDSPSGLLAANAAGAWCLAYRTKNFPNLTISSSSGQIIDDLNEVISIACSISCGSDE